MLAITKEKLGEVANELVELLTAVSADDADKKTQLLLFR
jgi:hypothetical protein